MNKRMYLGGLIVSPAAAVIIQFGYWTDPAANWTGWLKILAVTTGVFWLCLTGALVAFGTRQPGSER